METAILSGYATASYLLVVEPNAALQAKIGEVKKRFAESYDCPAAAAGGTNIMLVRFDQYEMLETRLLRKLETITRAQNSFLVELNDFGSYPTHSIFLNVVTRNQVTELLRSLRPMQQLLTMDKDHKPLYITEPHVVIARNLLPWQYEKGWLELSNTHFQGKFMADHLLLLRKRTGDKGYTAVRRFPLQNVKEIVTQGELFM